MTPKHRDIRLWFAPQEIELLHALLLDHVYKCIASKDLEPWEAKLLAKVGKSCNRLPERKLPV